MLSQFACLVWKLLISIMFWKPLDVSLLMRMFVHRPLTRGAIDNTLSWRSEWSSSRVTYSFRQRYLRGWLINQVWYSHEGKGRRRGARETPLNGSVIDKGHALKTSKPTRSVDCHPLPSQCMRIMTSISTSQPSVWLEMNLRKWPLWIEHNLWKVWTWRTFV